jgi:hypothetical protein
MTYIKEALIGKDKLDFLECRNGSVATLVSGQMVPFGSIDGRVYARVAQTNTHHLYRNTNAACTSWEYVTTLAGGGAISYIGKMGNNEVIVGNGNGLYRSTGWAVNPLTATWTLCLTPNGVSNFQAFQIDVWNNLVLVGEYTVPRTDSRFLKLSTDYGVTFTTVRDLLSMHPSDKPSTHWHAACIDGFKPSGNPRLWACHGDGPRAIIYSDDLGATWTTFNTHTSQPTTMTATKYGIVCSTDSQPDGIYRILRTDNPADMIYEPICYYRPAGAIVAYGLGFGTGAVRAPDGNVYITFRGEELNCPSVIFASDGIRADVVHSAPISLGICQTYGNPAVSEAGRIFAGMLQGGTDVIMSADLPLRGSRPYKINTPNIENGQGLGRMSIAIGQQTTANGYSTLIGHLASGSGQAVTVIGSGATTGSAEGCMAIGRLASATIANSMAIGPENCVASGIESTALGWSAKSGTTSVAVGTGAEAGVALYGGTAVGYNCKATAAFSTAIGRAAEADNGACAMGIGAIASGDSSVSIGYVPSCTGTSGVAIGKQAACTHTSSVAIGDQSATSAASQVALGLRHIEIGEVTAPGSPAANKVRIYVEDNGSGTTQLMTKFASGLSQRIGIDISTATTDFVQLVAFDWTVDVTVGDGKAYFAVPAKLNGMNLTSVAAYVITAGTTGTTDIQVARIRSGSPVDMLSTKMTIDSTETGTNTAATAAVINTSNDDVATHDMIRIDVDAVSTTAPKGLIITLNFDRP